MQEPKRQRGRNTAANTEDAKGVIGPLCWFPKTLRAVANWLPWVRDIVWVPHGGLAHVLRHGHTQRRYLNSLLLHALRRWWGHDPVLGPLQSALRLWQRRWLPGRSLCNLHSMPHAHSQLDTVPSWLTPCLLLQPSSCA